MYACTACVNFLVKFLNFFPIFPSPFSPSFIPAAKRSIVGGPPTITGFPADVAVVSMAVGASRAFAAFFGLFALGMDGIPAMLHDSVGCVSVEHGAPSASTVELPMYISASAVPLTMGAGCMTYAGSRSTPTPACAIHFPCTFTDGAIPLAIAAATAPMPPVCSGIAAASPAMISAMMSYTFPTWGTAMTGDGGVTVGCMSIPTDRSPNFPTGIPGMEGRNPASSFCRPSNVSLAPENSSPKARERVALSGTSDIMFPDNDIED